MFKLTKYEIRKNITGLVVLFGIIMGLEFYFLMSYMLENRTHTALSASLLVLSTVVAYFCVFIFGVASYSKELKSKTSYLTFMAPVSSYSVIGSKLLSTLAAGVFFAVLLVVLAMADMALFEDMFPETELFSQFISILVDMAGYTTAEFWLTAVVAVAELLISFFSIVAMAYLAITLSSTAFQNKKYKGVISVAIFVVIVILVSKLGNMIPSVYATIGSVSQAVISVLPQLAYFTAVIVVSLIVSARLLDRKVSL